MQASKIILGLVVLVIVAFWLATFRVDERDLAIKFRLGEIVRTDFEPGLYWKIPFIQNVRKFEDRILTLDAEPERYLTDEKKNVIVDAFVKWRIHDVVKYYNATGGIITNARNRLLALVSNGLKDEIGKRTIQEVVSGERSVIMDVLTEKTNRETDSLGITVLDVRVRRIDLPQAVSESVFQRMESERHRVARELRATGEAEAERIRAEADRKSEVILAEAYRDAERLRGEGDAQATQIYAKAHEKDPDFYALYRSLEAYQQTFQAPNDLLVLEPDSEFFNYFKSDQKRAGAGSTSR